MVDDAGDGLVDRGERWIGEPHQFGVVEADHRDVAGDVEATLADRSDRAERHHVAGRDDAGDAGVEQALRAGETAVEREDRLDDPVVEIAGDTGVASGVAETGELALHRRVAGRADQKADAFVARLTQVTVRGDRGGVVVGRHARHRWHAAPVGRHRAIDRDEADAAACDLVVDRVIGADVGVAPRHHDHAGDATFDQRVEVVVLGRADRRGAAQDAQVATRQQARLDGLDELGKDRIVELRHDQPDDAGARRVVQRLGGVAQFRQHPQHTVACGIAHTLLAVHDAADGGLADAGERRDVLEADPHGWDCTRLLQEMEEFLQISCRAARVSVM